MTSTVTRTTAAPSRSGAAQPHWEGAWLRNYSQGSNDCAQVDNYFVVQPHGKADTYMLRDGCFPRAVAESINSHCTKLFHGTVKGVCAIWDPDLTLSDPRRVGDIAVVALTQACLDRAHLPGYSTQHPVHKDCVVLPR
ncbi:hypothetical protein [Segniliparus rugosus]|uniref:hypothetical protein n=1 Tax=Segniliparus rugosus TaxID=286804 RepID=UPI0001F03E46|nr:hypothetical protein [Segniliparus rugosus]